MEGRRARTDMDSPFPLVLAAVHSVLAPHLPPGVPAPALDGLAAPRTLVGTAQRHGVLPLVLEGLRRTPGGTPSHVARSLRGLSVRKSLRTLALRAEIGRLTEMLHQAGIPFVVLKGVSVQEAYGSLTLRPSVDNDILIRPQDFEAFEQLLVEEGGYAREHRSAWQKRGYLLVHGQYTFRRLQNGTQLTLDAHTRVMPLGYRYHEDATDLLSRGRIASVDGVEVPVASWEDLVVVLCANGLKDRWNRLRLVADLVAVAAQIADWERVASVAERSNSRAQVALGLALARDLFGLPVPSAFAPVLPAVRRLAADIVERLRSASGEPGRWERARFYLAAQDGPRSRLRYVAYTALRQASEPLVRGSGLMTTDLD